MSSAEKGPTEAEIRRASIIYFSSSINIILIYNDDMLHSSTWNKLGLGVAATFVALGANWLVSPPYTEPTTEATVKNDAVAEPTKKDLGSLIAIRDVCIALSLTGLGFRGSQGNSAMGTVILSAMPLCMLDAAMLWKWNRKSEAIGSTVGAAIWAVIGFGLRGAFDGVN